MGRMAYPAPGVNLLLKRSLLAKPLPRAECVALGNARAVLYQVWSFCDKVFLSYQLHKVKGDRRTDRPTDKCNAICPPFSKGGINILKCNPFKCNNFYLPNHDTALVYLSNGKLSTTSWRICEANWRLLMWSSFVTMLVRSIQFSFSSKLRTASNRVGVIFLAVEWGVWNCTW